MQITLSSDDRNIIVQKVVLELNLVFYEDVSFQEVNKQVEDIKEAIIEQLDFSFKENFPTDMLLSKQILIGNIELEARGVSGEAFGKELAMNIAQAFNGIKQKIAVGVADELAREGNMIVTDLRINQKHSSNHTTVVGSKNIDNVSSVANTVAIKDELIYYFVHGRTRWQTFKAIFDFSNKGFVKSVEELLTTDAAHFVSLFSANANAYQRFVGTVPRIIVQKYYEAVLAPFESTGIEMAILQQLVFKKAEWPTQILVQRLFEKNRNLIDTGTTGQKVAVLIELLILLFEAEGMTNLSMAESQNAYVVLAKEIFEKHYPESKEKSVYRRIFTEYSKEPTDKGDNAIWQQAIAVLRAHLVYEKGILIAGATTFAAGMSIKILPKTKGRAIDKTWKAVEEKTSRVSNAIEGNEIDNKVKIEQQAILDEIAAIASAAKEQVAAPSPHIYIQNAGIVLIAPFLSAVFERMGYIKGNTFVSPQKQERAVKMICYLATGHHKPLNEEELLVGKILCGMHMDGFVSLKKLTISKNEKEQIGHLFDAIKQYWPVLKNTSVENLRMTFLQREGVLYTKNGNFLLKIDRTTIDILLDQVEWGFRMVKLPWCDYLLETEW